MNNDKCFIEQRDTPDYPNNDHEWEYRPISTMQAERICKKCKLTQIVACGSFKVPNSRIHGVIAFGDEE